MERERSGERIAWPLKFRSVVMLLNICNALQSAKSILPDVKNKLSIGIRSLTTSLQYFVTDYITEIEESEHHFY